MDRGEQARAAAPWRIGLLSATILILELTFIRQIPAEVRVISYFTNLILFAVFFGLGFGCILARWRSLAWTVPAGLAGVVAFLFVGRGIVVLDGEQGIHYWLQYAELSGQALHLPIFPAVVSGFLVTGISFVGLGQRLAREMDRHGRLTAYSWDLGGSLAGTLLFTASSALGVPPWVWPPLCMVAWALLLDASRLLRVASVASGLLFVGASFSPHHARWSPYYLVQHEVEETGLRVWVNSSFHQLAIDFRPQDPSLAAMRDAMMRKFSAPYDAYRALHGRDPAQVLILGAGTGNDVVVALHNRVQNVVAVEIDPDLLRLGQQLNSTAPYQDARVHSVVDDARHYLRQTRGRFDLIVFGTLDSQTLLTGHSNLRLDNYVYTREAFADARQALAPGGIIGLYYSVAKPWQVPRLLRTVEDGARFPCSVQRFDNPFLFNVAFICGQQVAGPQRSPQEQQTLEATEPATDDWPFVYLERPSIAPVYLQVFAVLAALVVVALVLVRRTSRDASLHAPFLLLGLGFTLIESASVVRLALLLGSTWTVNAVVFAGILLTVFGANLLVLLDRAPPLRVAWVGVAAGVLLNALLPLAWLVFLPLWARALVAAALAGVPVFFAGICFSRLFARQPATGSALGINLVGAMAGGGLEYLSMLIGMRGVWQIALVIYLGALLASRSSARHASAK